MAMWCGSDSIKMRPIALAFVMGLSILIPHRELYAESIDGCRNGLLSGVAMDSWVTQPWPVGAGTPPSLANGPCRNFLFVCSVWPTFGLDVGAEPIGEAEIKNFVRSSPD